MVFDKIDEGFDEKIKKIFELEERRAFSLIKAPYS